LAMRQTHITPQQTPPGRFAHLDDEQLVLGALIGDMEAFDELVQRFRGAVTAVALGVLGSRDAAEDVAQESLLLAFKALPQLEDFSKFGGWLCAITRHRARRVARREGHSEAHEPSQMDRLILEHTASLAAHPADVLMRRIEQAEVSDALAQLPPEYSLVLQLRYVEEWRVGRIADFLSLPITTVKWRLHHGRELMRRRLTEHLEEHDGRNDTQQSRTPQRRKPQRRADRKPARHAATAPPAAPDGESGARSQPDGKHGRRRTYRRAAIQSDSATS
jgi:RNA polymerase sigma-70 factor (ECF subfamily)